MNELELKFKCNNLENVGKRSLELGFIEKKPINQKDTWFLHGEQNAKGESIYLRVRQQANHISLDCHKPISALECEEIEVNIQDAEAVIKILVSLGFSPAYVVEKHRRVYQKEKWSVVCDDVKNLGTFVEIELMGKGSLKIEKEMKQLAQKLGLQLSDEISGKAYPDLMAERHS